MGSDYESDIDQSLAEVQEFDSYLVVSLRIQRFTAENAQEVFSVVKSFFQPQKDVIISLKLVEVMDSSGCGCLLKLHRYASQDTSRIVVIDANPGVEKLLYVLRFDRLASICHNLGEAIAELGAGN